MLKITRRLLVILVIATAACANPLSDKISLSRTEAAQAAKIYEHRMDLSVRIGKEQARFQEAMDRLNEEGRNIDIEAQQFVGQVKKSHGVDSIDDYRLDEINGQLIKVK